MNQNSLNRREMSSELAMGGQALIEGVMMRSPHRVAMAARKADGSIALRAYPYHPITRRNKAYGLPIVRGAIGMVEALKIGIDALNWSAEKSDPDQAAAAKKPSLGQKLLGYLSSIVAIAVGLGMFMYLPYLLAKLLVGGDQGQIAFHLIAGAGRILALVGYMWVISQFKDIFRVFQYHGSEHKTIFAYEQGQPLEAAQVLKQTRFHPRCGTSFLLIVAISAILFFVVVDTLVVALWGPYPNTLVRLAAHLPLIPLVAGLSYEFLRFSARHVRNPLVNALIQPGLWLQRITTKEPEGPMCEVAICALEEALRDPAEVIEVDTVFPPGTHPHSRTAAAAAAIF
ncbi:MAG: DUF1385 domain-containing protein [Calditrichaeota bacterium]|nr:DUF1385 domain-containing protein [Calditrichota bacterium]MCB9391024.1 DUF1385 domain-containing protein [Calditrichota bacterium]